jgi:hypothetical protein
MSKTTGLIAMAANLISITSNVIKTIYLITFHRLFKFSLIVYKRFSSYLKG